MKPFLLCLVAAILVVRATMAFGVRGRQGQTGPTGDLSVVGEVSVNGTSAISGATVFSDSTLTTTKHSSAVVSLGKLGRVEATKLGHGYLTYALVEEGLKTNAADRAPKDGQVLVREWLDFATARVPEMQLEKIEEQRKLGRELGLLIKFVESDTGADRNVQRPRVFYRRETENSRLIVARP